MSKVLVLVSSMRSNRAADGVLASVTARLNKKGADVDVADLRDLKLPFIDTPVSPKQEGFEIPAEYNNVKQWSQQVQAADAVVMLTPEYNAGICGAQKNAIDWLGNEWQGKKIGVIGYSWSGATVPRKHLSDVLAKLEAVEVGPGAGFSFMKELNLDGTAIDQAVVDAAIDDVVDALLA